MSGFLISQGQEKLKRYSGSDVAVSLCETQVVDSTNSQMELRTDTDPDRQTHSLSAQGSCILTQQDQLFRLRCHLFIQHLMHAQLHIFQQKFDYIVFQELFQAVHSVI